MRLEEGFRPVLVAEGKENENADFIHLNMGSVLHQDYQGEVAKSTSVFCDGFDPFLNTSGKLSITLERSI